MPLRKSFVLPQVRSLGPPQGVLPTNSTNSTPGLDRLETFTARIGWIQPTGPQDWLELDELPIHLVRERSGDRSTS